MYMIQIERYDLPAFLSSSCLFPASTNLNTAEEIWQFMIDNLQPGWQVTLLDDETHVVKEAVSAENAPGASGPGG
jgi:hypothetical protein